jgi:hypothetical protein
MTELRHLFPSKIWSPKGCDFLKRKISTHILKGLASGGHLEQIFSVSKIKIYLCSFVGSFLPSCFGSDPSPIPPPLLLLRERKEKTTGFLLSVRFAHFLGASIINLGLTVWIKTPLCQMHLMQLPKCTCTTLFSCPLLENSPGEFDLLSIKTIDK